MKFLKKNKFTIIAILIFMCLVVLGVKVKNLLVPDEGKAVYGDRLLGIENHELSEDLFSTISSKLKENEKVLDFTNTIHGKIINLMITVSDDMSVSDAKKIANSTISLFENDELSFYSLQVYVLKNDESLNNFPILGYKGTKSNELLYVKDREITSEEVEDEE